MVSDGTLNHTFNGRLYEHIMSNNLLTLHAFVDESSVNTDAEC